MSSFSAHHLVAVAVGGAVGSVSRYVVGVKLGHWLGTGFPYGTLTVNVVGCIIMGVLVELAALVWSPSPELRSLIMVGFLGGLTTFSSFALDTGVLWERNDPFTAMLYFMATLVLGIGGFFGSMYLIRHLFSPGQLP